MCAGYFVFVLAPVCGYVVRRAMHALGYVDMEDWAWRVDYYSGRNLALHLALSSGPVSRTSR